MTGTDSAKVSTRHNLLVDGIFSVYPGGNNNPAVISLPEVLCRLSDDTLSGFHNLLPHQRYSWHAFLVQVSALALKKSGFRSIPGTAREWTESLRGLTAGFTCDEPWCLAVNNLSLPAFLQPPVPENSLDGFSPCACPDDSALDILCTSRNHDLKSSRIRHPSPDHWAYALVALQTMQGFLGQGNYGISRMNGGFASRPSVSFAPGIEWGSRYRRDTLAILAGRKTLLEQHPYYRPEGGHDLLWLLPWDGEASLSMNELDPLYIEICRRVRLVIQNDALTAFRKATRNPRISADERHGYTGDPWTPVNKEKGTALTVGASGFDYRLMQEILFQGKFQPGLCLEIPREDGSEGIILAGVLVRGQGETNGWHEKSIPISETARNYLASPGEKEKLSLLSRSFVNHAAELRKRALRPALLKLVQGGQEDIKFKDNRVNSFIDAYERAVDENFFPFLWSALEMPGEEREISWWRFLVGTGREIIASAEKALPVPAVRRYRAYALATGLFESSTRKYGLKLEPGEQDE